MKKVHVLSLVGLMAILSLTSPTTALAALIWNYDSNDGLGGNSVTGTLTTDDGTGLPTVAGSVFTLLSIDTVIVNGTDITAPPNWFSLSGVGSPPPFESVFSGLPGIDKIVATGSGQAENVSFFLFASDTDVPTNSVRLSSTEGMFLFSTDVGLTPSMLPFSVGGDPIISFSPTSTTYTVLTIPEPSTFTLLGFAAGLFCFHRRQKR